MRLIIRWAPLAALVLIASLWIFNGDDTRARELERAYQNALSDTRSREAAYRLDRSGFRTDSANVQAVVYRYRTLRDTLDLTDTAAVATALTRADSAIAAGDSAIASASRALVSADSLISAKDREIGVLKQIAKVNKVSRVTPWAEVFYDPYSQEFRVRGGIDTRLARRLTAVVAGEAGKNGTSALVGARITF